MSAPKWSTPYCGLQHYTPLGKHSSTWATVTDRGSMAESSIYFPGCNFKPETSKHTDAQAARTHAERRIAALMGAEVKA